MFLLLLLENPLFLEEGVFTDVEENTGYPVHLYHVIGKTFGLKSFADSGFRQKIISAL